MLSVLIQQRFISHSHKVWCESSGSPHFGTKDLPEKDNRDTSALNFLNAEWHMSLSIPLHWLELIRVPTNLCKGSLKSRGTHEYFMTTNSFCHHGSLPEWVLHKFWVLCTLLCAFRMVFRCSDTLLALCKFSILLCIYNPSLSYVESNALQIFLSDPIMILENAFSRRDS